MLTVDELIEKLVNKYDPDDIITLLDIDSQELLDHFFFKVEERYDEVTEALEENELR